MLLVKTSTKSSMMGVGGIAVCFVVCQGMLLFTTGRCVGAVELFPFGPEYGFNVGSTDDNTFLLNLPFSVLVAGYETTSMSVSSNGFIDLVGNTRVFGTFSPGIVALLGYASDITTQLDRGDIWLQGINKTQDEVTRLNSDVHLVDADFSTSFAGVVTWENVAAYFHRSTMLRNSFQIIVAWDEVRKKTFGILNYEKLEWADYQMVGFNGGNTNTSFQIGQTLSDEELRNFLLTESNVGVPGKFVMRLDGGDTCIGFIYPQMSIDGGPWTSDKVTNMSFARDQRIELRCQSDPDGWDGSQHDLKILCDNGRAGSFDNETKMATFTVDMRSSGVEDWLGVTCRCQTVPPSCTLSVTFETPLEAPTMKSFTIDGQTAEVVTVDSNPEVTRVVFECVAEGYPTPWIAVMGLHTGSVIANQSAPDNTLRIDTAVTCSHWDQYVCVAENSIGTSNRSSTILLRVPCLESMEDPETVLVSDDSIVNVAFKVKAFPNPTSFSLSKVRGGRTNYVDELVFDPSYYVVQYTKTDDVLGLGTVQLKVIDFDLVDMNLYRFRMSDGGKGGPLEISFMSTRERQSQVYTSQDSGKANLIVVAVIGCVLVCVCAVLPIAYWYYADKQGIRPLSTIPQKMWMTLRKKNHRSPSSVYTLLGQTREAAPSLTVHRL